MPIVALEHISKRFGSTLAVDDVSIFVEQGEAVAIIGSSGSGKSTLLRCINHLERVDYGTIQVDGEYLATMPEEGKKSVYPPDKEIRKICMKTGMVFQHFNLFPHLTCLENITIAPIHNLNCNKEDAIQKAKELLEVVGLPHKTDAYPEQLSGGQKQRVAIARALAMNPEIMLFDEPTSALDPEITGEVTNVIVRLVERKVTMLMVTHDMQFAREASSRVIYMDQGKIVEEGAPEQIFTQAQTPRLKDFLSAVQSPIYHVAK